MICLSKYQESGSIQLNPNFIAKPITCLPLVNINLLVIAFILRYKLDFTVLLNIYIHKLSIRESNCQYYIDIWIVIIFICLRNKANSYKVVLLAQLIDFLSTWDCQIFCLRTVSKKTCTYYLQITFEQKIINKTKFIILKAKKKLKYCILRLKRSWKTIFWL